MKEIRDFTTSVATPNDSMRANLETYDTPLAWWTVCGLDYPKLRHIAMSLYTVPTSSAASERIWSIFDFIHCKRRNRLRNERVDKLVFLYANHALGANDNVLNDWFDDECN